MPTKIEWCDEVWNPITGCTPISEGCQNCYAKRMAQRLKGRYGYPADEPFKPGIIHNSQWDKPSKWQQPKKIFVCSMGDLFHSDVDVDSLVYTKLSIEFQKNPHHKFLILTKRPEKMKWVVDRMWNEMNRLPNVWLGVTAENQKRADERIPILLQIPAAVRFVSVEPMLGPVDLSPIEWPNPEKPCQECNTRGCENCGNVGYLFDSIDWVICGAETGPGARPMITEWAINLHKQCKDAGVPFFFKKDAKSKGHLVPDIIRNTREFPK